MPAPSVLPLKDFLALMRFPSRPPLLFLTRRQSQRFTSGAEKITPKEWERVVKEGMPILKFTPYPEGDVVQTRCFSLDQLCCGFRPGRGD